MSSEGDSINVGDISNATVAIGKGASVTVINRLVQGLGDLPTQHDASVKNFLDYYIGAPDSPAPFGGRDADLAAYTRWLDDPAAPPYALLTAPAGKGKSAVLVHWVLQIAPRADVAVVFIPISDRFQINSESAVFSALYARLAHLHGERPTQAFSVDQYRGAFQDYLSRPLPDGRRLVIVLDGLDEAAGWEARTGLFPTQAPQHLKVLVTAREVAGDVTWATRLGWRSPRDAVSLRLEGLSRAALDDVLRRMGNPLAGLPVDFQLVDKLYELTDQGDPLLIGLYVEALRLDRDRLPDLRPENLLDLKPGLASFFDLWFERQEHLWRAESSPVDRRAVDTLLHARAMAFGPLTAEDLNELAPETFSAMAGVRRVAQALRRFLVGSGARGSGYSFSHPRLAQYFQDQLSVREREEWHRRFIGYGAATLARLEGGGLKPGDASEYVVRHYRLHLQRQNDSFEPLCALMSRGWLRAWQALEGTEAGFLNDVHAAMERAALAGPEGLGQVIRGALCFSSVAALGSQMDSRLMALAMATGSLNPRVALHLARKKPDEQDKVNALLVVADSSDRTLARDLLVEALETARRVPSRQSRAWALCAVARRLPSDEARRVLNEAIAAAEQSELEAGRVRALCEIAKQLPAEEFDLLIRKAFRLAKEIGAEPSRSWALKSIAETSKPDSQDLLHEILLETHHMSGAWSRARVYVQALGKLPQHETTVLAQECLDVARRVEFPMDRVETLSAVASFLPAEDAHLAVEEALKWARQMTSEDDRARALRVVSSHLPADKAREVINEALLTARAIDDASYRAGALRELTAQLPSDVASQVVSEALAAVREIGDQARCAQALSAIAALVPEVDGQQILSGALKMARKTASKAECALALCSVSGQLPAHESRLVLEDALALLRHIGDESSRGLAIRALSRSLHDAAPDLQATTLEEARAIRDELTRVEAIASVAEGLSVTEARQALREALITVGAIEVEKKRAYALCAIGRALPVDDQELTADVMTIARSIKDKWGYSVSLGAMAKRLPQDEIQVELNGALSSARLIENVRDRVEALCALGEVLPLEAKRHVLVDALEWASGIGHEQERTMALWAVMGQMPMDDHDLLADLLKRVRTLAPENHLAFLSELAEKWEFLASDSQCTETLLLVKALSLAPFVQRPTFVLEIGALAPVIARIGGESTLYQMVASIIDVIEWWP